MLNFLVILFILILTYFTIQSSKGNKKEEKKPAYKVNPNINYSNGAHIAQSAVKREDIPKKRIREKKAEFPNTRPYVSDFVEYRYSVEENVKVTEIPEDLDFSLLKLHSVKFEVEKGEDRYYECVKIFQDDTFLGCLEKGSRCENNVWFWSDSSESIPASLVYINEEKRELKISYATYWMSHKDEFKAEYTDSVMLLGASDFKEFPKDIFDGNLVELQRDKGKGKYIVLADFAGKIGEIPESDLGMLLYYMENEKEYFYVPVINILTDESAKIEISVYRKKEAEKRRGI